MADLKRNRSTEAILAEGIVHVDVVFAKAGKIRAVGATALGITILPPALPGDFEAAASAAVGGREVSLRYVLESDVLKEHAPDPMGQAA